MLVNFTFKNVRSFYNETMFSMEASKDSSFRDFNVFTPIDNRQINNKCDLLKSALIFGPNASGKSNFIKSLNFMKIFVLSSASMAQGSPIELNKPFAFYENAKKEGSLYEVEIIENEIFYRYGFIIREGTISAEWLETINGRTTKLFDRRDGKLFVRGFSAKQTELIDIPETVLFISIGNSFNSPIKDDISNVFNWFKKLTIVFEESSNCIDIYNRSDEYKAKALEVLKNADIGINGLEVTRNKIGETGPEPFKLPLRVGSQQILKENNNIYDLDLLTRYEIYDNEQNHNPVGEKDIHLFKDYDFNSEGTVKLLMYLGYILEALDQGRVVVIDEIDSRLHFLVSDHLIQMFNSIDENPNNAQLIATAHNVMLMDGDLRRDQIYFTSKDQYGVSDMKSLADFKDVRKTDLFSKKYLAGFYTNLPDFNRGI